MREEVLRMEHIRVKSRGRYALDDFRLNLYQGELVLVFGFSGNGLHELGQVLSGQPAESGRLLVAEKEINARKMFYPEKHGVFVIRSRDNLIPDLTVTENLFLGEHRNIFAVPVARRKQERLAASMMERFGLDFNVRRRAREYEPYYEQMMIKLVKAYVKGARVVVIDEILEVSAVKNWEQLFRIINLLREDGIAVLWLSQRLEPVWERVDRTIVMRGGRNVKTFYGHSEQKETVMRTASEQWRPAEVRHPALEQGEAVFRTRALSGGGITSLDLELCKHQIVGIFSDREEDLKYLHHVTCGDIQDYAGSMELAEPPMPPQAMKRRWHLGYSALTSCGRSATICRK